MTRAFMVRVPDELGDQLERLILEAIEPGAATHCRQILWDPQGIVGSRHPRLGVTIKEVR